MIVMMRQPPIEHRYDGENSIYPCTVCIVATGELVHFDNRYDSDAHRDHIAERISKGATKAGEFASDDEFIYFFYGDGTRANYAVIEKAVENLPKGEQDRVWAAYRKFANI